MGIQKGSISLSRYRIIGGKKSYKLNELNECLNAFKAGKINLSSQETDYTGWVQPIGLELDGPKQHWDMSDCRVDDGFFFRARIEKKKIPTALFQILLQEKLHAWEAEHEKQVPRKEKRNMVDVLKQDLLCKSLPAVSHVDMYWHEERKDLILFTTSKAQKQLVVALFEATFASPLNFGILPIEPPLLGMDKELWNQQDMIDGWLGKLATTVPVSFAEHA